VSEIDNNGDANRANRLSHAIRNYGAAAVTLLLIMLCGFWIEEHDNQFQWLVTLQLKLHSTVSHLDPRKPHVERVAVAAIDDSVYWQRLGGAVPTDRDFIARVIRALAGHNRSQKAAAVIAIDIEFTSPNPNGGDDPKRKQANEALLEAVREAVSKGIPVVLAKHLYDNASKILPNIFPDDRWPSGTLFGYINLPFDRRLVPLRYTYAEGRELRSFGLQLARAYESVRSMPMVDESDALIQRTLSRSEFVYGGFLKPEAFLTVRAEDLAEEKDDALRQIQQRVVIIGSTWHELPGGHGNLIDVHDTPVGRIPGVYIHANYAESLLDGRYKRPVSSLAAAVIDLALGVALIASFHRLRQMRARLVILGLLALPAIGAYILFVSSGLYLDFALPMLLLVVHLLTEERIRRKRVKVTKGAI
jgi:CHASE2 domain-containing sensor protein